MRSLNTKPALHNILPIKISNDMQNKFFDESSKITIDLTNDTEDKHDKFTWQGYHKGIGSCSSYRGLKNFVKGENRIPSLPVKFAGDDQCEEDEIDDYSLTLIPCDVPAKFKNHKPVEIFPVGNCFFRSLSRFVYGNERHHLEMRCRVVNDLVRYDNNSMSHEYLIRGAKHLHRNCFHIGAYYCAYSGISNVGDLDGSLEGSCQVFEENTMRIRHLCQYSDIWHLHSAANVLNTKIMMVFPNRSIRHDVRVDMNRVFLPSTSDYQNKFYLLWTAVCDVNVNSDKLSATPKRFDHIIPMIHMEVKICKFPKRL